MNMHHIKIYPEHYENVSVGTKTFEIRNNDRAYQKGDIVHLYYWPRNADSTKNISEYVDPYHPVLSFRVGDVYPIDSERVVFSLLEFKF